MLQTTMDTPFAIEAILARAAALAAGHGGEPVFAYDLPAEPHRSGGLTIADIDEAAREVHGLFACVVCGWKIL